METEQATRERHTTWVLARLAGCGDPDRADVSDHAPPCNGESYGGGCTICDGSPGARFLRSVENAVADAIDEERAEVRSNDWRDDWTDVVHEIADAAPDIYTYTRWQEFTDLAAWQEDVTGYGPFDGGSDGGTFLTDLAGVALYMIAERLAWALLEELAEEDAGDADDALDVWLRIPEGEEGAEAEANTYRTPTGYRVDWSLTTVGLVASVDFGTPAEAHAWLEAEGFADFTS